MKGIGQTIPNGGVDAWFHADLAAWQENATWKLALLHFDEGTTQQNIVSETDNYINQPYVEIIASAVSSVTLY